MGNLSQELEYDHMIDLYATCCDKAHFSVSMVQEIEFSFKVISIDFEYAERRLSDDVIWNRAH